MPKQYEYKQMIFPAMVVKVDEAKGIIESVVNIFGIIDLGEDIVHPGSFTKTINERMGQIRVLDNHQTRSVTNAVAKALVIREIGREELKSLAPQVVQKHPEATGGLYTVSQYMMDDPLKIAPAVFYRIVQDIINEYSFGFNIIRQDFSEVEHEGKKVVVRNIREVRLMEYSPVLWGMNQATVTVGAKTDEPTEEHEFTPDGPVQRLGDFLGGAIHSEYCRWMDMFLMDGFINLDEHSMMSILCDAAMSMMKAGLPEDVRLRPLSSPRGMLMGFDPASLRKLADSIEKELTKHEDSDTVEGEQQDSAPEETAGPQAPEESASTENQDEQIKRQLELELALLEVELYGSTGLERQAASGSG